MKTHETFCDKETLRQFEEALQIAIDEELTVRYGDHPDPLIQKRIREEWHAMECTGTLPDIATLHEISMWLKENGYPYYLQHATGSSFIGYLLGIGSVNPLLPHFYCPKCKKVQWVSDEADGFDLPKDHVCPDDGTTLLVDGHNIPWQMLWGYGDYEPWFYMRITEDAYDGVVQHIQEHWLFSEVQPTPELKTDHFGDKCIFFPRVRIYFSLKPVPDTDDFHSRIVDSKFAADPQSFKLVMDPYGFSYKFRIKLFMRPQNFADLVCLDGMGSRTSKNKLMEFYMCRCMGYRPTDLIAFQDSVYQYLMSHGFVPKDAWKGSLRVRRGQGLPVITRDMELARDKWVLTQCARTRYLNCKANALESIFYRLKLSMKT